MQIKRLGDIESFLKAPPAAVEGVLCHGCDAGLVRERSKSLEAATLGHKPDPFGLVELSEAQIKEAPGALYAEAAALAMLGGRKFIRLRMSAEASAAALAAYLAERKAGAPRGDGLFVIEAGDLRATNALRKAAEGSPLIAAIACYSDTEASLESLVDDAIARAGARIETDAKAALLERLGADRGLSRQEIDKLLLYCGAAPGRPVTIRRQDIAEIVGDAGAAELETLIDAVFVGNVREAALLSARLAAGGAPAIRILRAISMHLDRLGGSAGGRGGFNFYQSETLRRHQSRWPPQRIARAQALVLEAEIQCKTTGLPAEEICERTLLALARGAQSAPIG